MNGWMDRWTDGWMDGWMDDLTYDLTLVGKTMTSRRWYSWGTSTAVNFLTSPGCTHGIFVTTTATSNNRNICICFKHGKFNGLSSTIQVFELILTRSRLAESISKNAAE
jgi:phenolic acid decarboxylase